MPPNPATPLTPPKGADKLKKQIQTAARQAQAAGPASPLRPLLDAVRGLAPPAGLVRDIGAAVGEDGDVLESASEQVCCGREGASYSEGWIVPREPWGADVRQPPLQQALGVAAAPSPAPRLPPTPLSRSSARRARACAA
jgi:hypothetical protein